MKVTFPHMGNLFVTVRAVLEGLGLEVVVPPPITKRTLSLGTKHAPEFACLPLKINLGNYMEAAEMGADTIVMAGGVGPCRFGYYAQIQKEILRDLGYNMNMVVLEPPDAHLGQVLEQVRSISRQGLRHWVKGIRLAWHKTCTLDLVERKVQRIRPREITPGTADRVFNQAISQVDAANTLHQVVKIKERVLQELDRVPVDLSRPVLKIAVVGEIYTILEPFANLNIEKHLGRMGAEVTRSIYLSQWINDHLLGGLLPVKGCKKAKKLAKPYLNHFVGGHGRETVGGVVEYALNGYDGVIQVAPLTCMPEIVAQSIIPKISRELDIPTMTLYVDEQSGEAGLVTRLEAFIDMIFRHKTIMEARTWTGI